MNLIYKYISFTIKKYKIFNLIKIDISYYKIIIKIQNIKGKQ